MSSFFFLVALCLQDLPTREPKPEEIGYRPAPGESARLNPPSLTWVHERAARTYDVQWATKEDFSDAASAGGFPWNVYTHHEALRPGTYRWRYRFVDARGKPSGWSVARTFVVPEGAVPFPMPTRAQQRERVPLGHPRLFMRPEDLPRLRAAAKEKGFAKLRQEADRLLGAAPTPEPEVKASAHDPKTTHLWWPNRMQTIKACDEACTLAFVYLLTGDNKYGEAARERILGLAAWDPDGPTKFTLNCEAAKPLLYRLPRAYDWAYDALTAEDRQKVRAAMLRRATDAWKSREILEGVGHLNQPYNSHGNRVWHKLMECAIAFLGEVPEAETWLDYGVNKFFACYPVWSDDDGGWHEGVSYWAGYMGKVVWGLQVMKSALEIDGLKKPFFAQVGDFPLYVAPPGSPNCGFGDNAYRRASQGWGGFMEYFLRANRDAARAGYWRWWTQRWKMDDEGEILGFLYDVNLGPLPEPKAPTDLPASKVFHGIGVASLHSTILDSADDVHVLFKSSPFGGRSHGHNAQNGFQLNAYGESLLPTCVYRDLHGSKFHVGWVHNTVSQNAVLVNGQGQVKHSVAPTGRIVEERLGPDFDYVAGDATDAYGGRLASYRRHVLFAKPDVVVLYDALAAKEPSTFQFMLHGHRAFDVGDGELRIEMPKAGALIRYLSPTPLGFRQWDGYDPKPDKETPNMWHVEASTREKTSELGMLTVIVPHRKRGAWTAQRVESPAAVGVRFTRDGKTLLLAFRKGSGAATLDARTFEGPASVLPYQ